MEGSIGGMEAIRKRKIIDADPLSVDLVKGPANEEPFLVLRSAKPKGGDDMAKEKEKAEMKWDGSSEGLEVGLKSVLATLEKGDGAEAIKAVEALRATAEMIVEKERKEKKAKDETETRQAETFTEELKAAIQAEVGTAVKIALEERVDPLKASVEELQKASMKQSLDGQDDENEETVTKGKWPSLMPAVAAIRARIGTA